MPPPSLLLDRASARSERPSTTNTAKREIRSVMCLIDDALFNIRCLRYDKKWLFTKEMVSDLTADGSAGSRDEENQIRKCFEGERKLR